MAEKTAKNTLSVELVAVTQRVWEGEATLVRARTVEGDIGIMSGHTPVLSKMNKGELLIRTVDGEEVTAETEGGFFSVDNNKVTIVADNVHLTDGNH